MEEYYVTQAGSGIEPYRGVRYQKGHGLFSDFIKGKLLPILKSVLPYLGRSAIDTGMKISEGIRDGQSFKEATKKALKKKAFDMAEDGLVTLRRQTGVGLKRQRQMMLKCINLATKTKRRRRKRTRKSKKTRPARKSKRKTIKRKRKSRKSKSEEALF